MTYAITTLAKSTCKGTMFWSLQTTQFGPTIIASVHEAVCFVGFTAFEKETECKKRFPLCKCVQQEKALHLQMAQYINGDGSCPPLCLVGTVFQQQVWSALLSIKIGSTTTYGTLAVQINQPKAVRAVGTAVGANPIAYIVPCHRVLPANGAIGGYHWGSVVKAILLQSEH